MNKVNNYYWADTIRVFAPFFVMLLHAAAPLVASYGNVRSDWWWTGFIIDSFARPCVPLYVMLSGCFILNRDYTLPDFFRKRVFRVLLPFFFWSVILVTCNILIFKKNYNWSHFPIQFLTEPVYYHLWYVHMLISLYLITPLLRSWIKQMGNDYTQLYYFIGIWFIISTIFPIFYQLTGKSIVFQTQYIFGFIGYYILGYYIGNCNIPISKEKQNKIGFILWISGFILTIFAVYYHSLRSGKLNEFWFDNLSPNLIIMSVGMFILFKNLIPQKHEGKKTKFIKKISYGLYLSHAFMLDIIKEYWFNYTFIHPIIAIVLSAIICYISCSLIIAVIQRIPYGKYLTG